MSPPGGDGILPARPEHWDDLARLFGARGACGGCWCMWWRLPRADFVRGKGEGNRRALEAIVKTGGEPGLIAWRGGEPAGWIALAPRAAYPRFLKSRTLAPVDDEPVWSITCFFVAPKWRRQGLSRSLVEAAADFARAKGGGMLEAYPIDAGPGPQPAPFIFTGIAATFRKAGFTECARRSPTRPIMRRRLA
jgi:GNAT superfamily N-acetyltransferase